MSLFYYAKQKIVLNIEISNFKLIKAKLYLFATYPVKILWLSFQNFNIEEKLSIKFSSGQF